MGNVYSILSEKKILSQPDNYSQRLIIERCENIHFHYRDLRLEFSINEFIDVCRVFKEALPRLQAELFSNTEIKKIPIDKIDPFDAGHRAKGNYFDCGVEQEDHENGITVLKEWISAGHYLLPIAVYPNGDYIRLDGFKRFWAYKELGYKEIDCYVLNEYVAGIQEGMNIYEP